MILDLLAGFIIICLLILFAAALSVAITYWFISIPLFILWFRWAYKREQRRQRNIPPQEQARQDRDLARWRAGVTKDQEAKARRKAMYR